LLICSNFLFRCHTLGLEFFYTLSSQLKVSEINYAGSWMPCM
jgi:hypothetical protein